MAASFPIGPPNVGIVFQSFALFPWLTVLENVAAPLEARGVPDKERQERALKDSGRGGPGWI